MVQVAKAAAAELERRLRRSADELDLSGFAQARAVAAPPPPAAAAVRRSTNELDLSSFDHRSLRDSVTGDLRATVHHRMGGRRPSRDRAAVA